MPGCVFIILLSILKLLFSCVESDRSLQNNPFCFWRIDVQVERRFFKRQFDTVTERGIL